MKMVLVLAWAFCGVSWLLSDLTQSVIMGVCLPFKSPILELLPNFSFKLSHGRRWLGTSNFLGTEKL